jgi:hypothetical protein
MKIKKVKQGPFDIGVREDDNIVLSVTIGNAQIGGNLVKLGTEQLQKGEIKNLDLGQGKDLVGKKLTVVTNVLDVNPSSNKVSVTHLFINGTPTVFNYPPLAFNDMEVDEDGDILSLTATYSFSKKSN